MTYFARPGQKSAHEKESGAFKNLTVFNSHLNKQLIVQQQILKNYQQKLSQLQDKKNYLLSLVQQPVQKPSPQQSMGQIDKEKKVDKDPSKDQLQSVKNVDKIRIYSKHQSSQKNTNPLRTKPILSNEKQRKLKGDRSLLMNRSRISSKKQTLKQHQTNYLSNMNEYKHKDLAEEVTSLMKQLNSLINKSTVNKDSIAMGKSMLMQKSSTLMENKSLFMQNKSLLMESKYTKAKGQQVGDISQQQFTNKYLPQLGCLQKLPSANPDPMDEVIKSLIANLQKQQSLLVNKIFKYKHLQIQKIIKQNMHQKTVQNMRIIYNLNKQKQQKINKKQLKSTKDLIKFGYTDQMLLCIQQKTKNSPIYH